jgi:hypothetical protein
MTLGSNSKEIIPFGMADKNHGCGCARFSFFIGANATEQKATKQKNKNN